MEQSYKNYLRFYTPHHFVFYPVTAALLAFSVYESFTADEKKLWMFISLCLILLIWLSYMMRQHYALTLQDRIIRLEVRYRYFTLTGKRLEAEPTVLTDAQLFALRFASDAEFEQLVTEALAGKSAGSIKHSITNWLPDHHRV